MLHRILKALHTPSQDRALTKLETALREAGCPTQEDNCPSQNPLPSPSTHSLS